MPIPTRAELKALFETGDHPTQEDFALLIDAMFDLAQAATDVADEAAATATAAAAAAEQRAARAYAAIRYNSAGVTWVVDLQVGCTVALSGTKNSVVTITFTDAFADTKYLILPGGSVTEPDREELSGPGWKITAKNMATLVITLEDLGGALSDGETFNVAVFR